MRKLLCALLVAAVLLPAGVLAEGKKDVGKKGVALTLDFFAGLSYDTSFDAFVQLLQEAGGKPKIEKQPGGRRDRYLTMRNFTLEGVPVRLLDAEFTADAAHFQNLELDIAPRASATYMKPGAGYDALLAALTAKLGEPTRQRNGPTSYDKDWDAGHWNVTLRYDNGRREQRKRIALFLGYPNPNYVPSASEPAVMPEPAEFVWPAYVFSGDAMRERTGTNNIRMGMTREEVKAAETGTLKSGKKDTTLRYNVTAYDGYTPARCDYRFDESGKLAEITLQYTKTPWDVNDHIHNFQSVDGWLTYDCYGKPERDDPMVWAPEHKYDPLDGSAWIKAVKKGALTYRSDWTVGGVRVEHLLAGVKGKIVHTVRCWVESPGIKSE